MPRPDDPNDDAPVVQSVHTREDVEDGDRRTESTDSAAGHDTPSALDAEPAPAGDAADRQREPGGYDPPERDLDFAGVSAADYQAMEDREKPLGFEQTEDWERCATELREALQEEGLDDADARIRGSATEFQCGPHKPFPQNEEECVQQAQQSEDGLPEDEVRERWRTSPYADGQDLPERHSWDSRYNLGIVKEPSDYDFQVSSDKLAERMDARYPDGKADDDRTIVSVEHGGHYKFRYVAEEFPALDRWSQDWQDRTGRECTIASFDGGGPRAEETRFNDNDWILEPKDEDPERRGA